MSSQLERRVEPERPAGRRSCVSCGRTLADERALYCREGCKKSMQSNLAHLARGTFGRLGVDFALFGFTDVLAWLDVASQERALLARFSTDRRQSGTKVLPSWCVWQLHDQIAVCLETESVAEMWAGHRSTVDLPDNLKSVSVILGAAERKAARTLGIDPAELVQDADEAIRAAYWKAAFRHHPDLGGGRQEMTEINTAVEILRQWSEQPRQLRHNRLPQDWCWTRSSGRWHPPLSRHAA